MKQDEQPAAMSEHDQQLFEDMACRIELTLLWTELSALLTPAYTLPRYQPLGKPWRAYPLPRDTREQFISQAATAALRNVNGTGPDVRVFTLEQIRNTRDVALNCLEARSNDWGDGLLPWPGHRGAH